jgi:hypothetical protein
MAKDSFKSFCLMRSKEIILTFFIYCHLKKNVKNVAIFLPMEGFSIGLVEISIAADRKPREVLSTMSITSITIVPVLFLGDINELIVEKMFFIMFPCYCCLSSTLIE